MPTVLCIAGLDPTGYSGLSADSRALDFLGVRCLPVASVLTVQNAKSFSEFQPVPSDLIAKQVDAIFNDVIPDAIKVGMLGTADMVRQVAEMIGSRDIPAVIDPVFSSSTGFSLLDDDLLDAYRHDLMPVASLVTPNASEASALSRVPVNDVESAEVACRLIFDLGPAAVLVKGGHLETSRGTDILCDKNGFTRFAGKEVAGKVRGTGCTYSSLIAGHLAIGLETRAAVEASKDIMSRSIADSVKAGSRRLLFDNPRPKNGGKP